MRMFAWAWRMDPCLQTVTRTISRMLPGEHDARGLSPHTHSAVTFASRGDQRRAAAGPGAESARTSREGKDLAGGTSGRGVRQIRFAAARRTSRRRHECQQRDQGSAEPAWTPPPPLPVPPDPLAPFALPLAPAVRTGGVTRQQPVHRSPAAPMTGTRPRICLREAARVAVPERPGPARVPDPRRRNDGGRLVRVRWFWIRLGPRRWCLLPGPGRGRQ